MQTLIQRIFGGPATPADPVPTPAPVPGGTLGGYPATKPGQELLFPEQITPETLLGIFRQAFMDVETMAGGPLRVHVDGAGHVLVRVDTERKMLSFVQHYGLKEEASLLDKLQLANRINDQVVLVRLTVADETTLVSDHFMGFDGTITARQIVEGVRRFARITRAAITKMDHQDIVV